MHACCPTQSATYMVALMWAQGVCMRLEKFQHPREPGPSASSSGSPKQHRRQDKCSDSPCCSEAEGRAGGGWEICFSLSSSRFLSSRVVSTWLVWPHYGNPGGEAPASPKEPPQSCHAFELMPSMGTDHRGGGATVSKRPHPYGNPSETW